MEILYKNQVVAQDRSVFVRGGTCFGFIEELCKLRGWPPVRKEISASQSLASASTHVLYVTEANKAVGERGRQKQMARSLRGTSVGLSPPHLG